MVGRFAMQITGNWVRHLFKTSAVPLFDSQMLSIVCLCAHNFVLQVGPCTSHSNKIKLKWNWKRGHFILSYVHYRVRSACCNNGHSYVRN